jgi:hypothetical protein
LHHRPVFVASLDDRFSRDERLFAERIRSPKRPNFGTESSQKSHRRLAIIRSTTSNCVRHRTEPASRDVHDEAARGINTPLLRKFRCNGSQTCPHNGSPVPLHCRRTARPSSSFSMAEKSRLTATTVVKRSGHAGRATTCNEFVRGDLHTWTRRPRHSQRVERCRLSSSAPGAGTHWSRSERDPSQSSVTRLALVCNFGIMEPASASSTIPPRKSRSA